MFGVLDPFLTLVVPCYSTEDAVRIVNSFITIPITSLQSLTIISYAVTRLQNYNPYTYVTTVTYYTLTHLHWLTSQLSITVSNYHTLPGSVSYRDLIRGTAPYKLKLYRRGPSGYLLCTDIPKTAAIFFSCLSGPYNSHCVVSLALRGDEP
jgi:hypothetical protein